MEARHERSLAAAGVLEGLRVFFSGGGIADNMGPAGTNQKWLSISPEGHSGGGLRISSNTFAQNIGVALTGLGKRDDLVRDGLFYVVVAVSGMQGDADEFERNPQDARGLWIEPLPIEIWADRHGSGNGR
jgi:hypothetical protein